jgi:beta-mannosidase
MYSSELRARATARGAVEAHRELVLDQGWEAGSCLPDAVPDPASLDGLEWIPATVPGTAAAALGGAGRWAPGEARDLDAEDWWFRIRFEAEPAAAGEELVLHLDGIATVAEVYLNGSLLLESDSMFAAHAVDVGGLLRNGANELAIRCRALAPLLRVPRKPRARWRTRLADNGLRFYRTMLLGRAPGIAPGPAAVGPWRPVRLQRRRLFAVDRLETRAELDGEDGVLSVRASLRGLDGELPRAVEVELSGPSGSHSAALALEVGGDGVEASGALRVPAVARWWPHTHGEPALHEVRLRVATGSGPVAVEAGRVGFRDLDPGSGSVIDDGLDLRVNGVRVFARGAVWTPLDPVGLAPPEGELRQTLESARDAGLNMLRVVGTAAYESAAFHDLCDELGILVWQDFMFANFDYPIADEAFRAAVEAEAQQALETVAGRPSLAVLCGNSEVEQQVAMMGLDPALGRGELFGELLPSLCAETCPGVTYLPSAPCGADGELPFRTDGGVANYFGVGGYRRPLSDARAAGVRFASECLAFANVPGEGMVEEMLGAGFAGPDLESARWKAGVSRDAGADWDFEDVRDHYLQLLFGVDPAQLRQAEPERYLELSRAASGEAMAAVFGEWRRGGSPCAGGLMLWLRDLVPGAGWGLLDSDGAAKVAYHHLRRALAPTAVWMTDEGLNGVGVHLANDGPEPLAARLRIALYRGFEQRVGEACEEIELPAHGAATRDVEGLLGRFADASWAYRFGPPAQDLIVASLERGAGEEVETISQAVFFPDARPIAPEPADQLGLEARVEPGPDGSLVLVLECRRFVYGLRIHGPGLTPEDDALSLEPGARRRVVLRPRSGEQRGEISLTAPNLQGRFAVGETS